MTFAPDPVLEHALERLAPYARGLVHASAAHAVRLHARWVGPEHLLGTVLSDDASAAYRGLVRAFVDPETLAAEVLALTPGILVVGSGRSMPFSTRGVEALEQARALAARSAATAVTPAHLLRGALDALGADERAALGGAGLRAELAGADAAPGTQGNGAKAVAGEGPLFESFDQGAKQACAIACRVAVQLRREAISPAHLVFALLEQEPGLQERSGLSLVRARAALRERDDDPTAPLLGALPADAELLALLGGLAQGADSLDLLAAFVTGGTPELRLLLDQQQVRPDVVERARGTFRDPEPPARA